MKDEDCTCEWVTIHDMTGDIQEVMAQKDQFCISHGMVKCICIWDQTYNMHADPVPYISEIHPRCPQHTDAALQGICDLCEQELILTHDDCWHPHTVEIACPPPDHRGLGSGRPGKEHWKPSNAFLPGYLPYDPSPPLKTPQKPAQAGKKLLKRRGATA